MTVLVKDGATIAVPADVADDYLKQGWRSPADAATPAPKRPARKRPSRPKSTTKVRSTSSTPTPPAEPSES